MAFWALDRIQYNTHLPDVQRFTQKYYLKRTMLRGKYNALAYGHNKITRAKVLIKSIYTPEPCKLAEATVLKKLLHVPGVITYLDHYAIKCNIYFLVMEYFGHMDLQFFLSTNGAVSEKIGHTIFKQLATTVQECFKQNILHRKLTLNNILIDVRTNQVKITNFSSASQFDDADELTAHLVDEIASPEYLETTKYTADGLYTWSLGLILYKLLFNKKPFNSTDDVINTPLTIPPHNPNLSLNVINFLHWMLSKYDRITLHQLTHHPWITKTWI
jgi:serine/threonine protein kinase